VRVSRGTGYVILSLVRSTGAQRILEEKGEITGYFELQGLKPDQAAPGILRYSAADGTTLRLVDAPAEWPTSLGHRGDLVVHGTTLDGGHPLTLLDAHVSSLAFGNRPTGVRAATLALGAHFDRETTWSCATYMTAHLHEWLGDSGLRHDSELDERGQTQRLTYEWKPPPAYDVVLDDARVTIGPAMQSEWGRIADWCVRTGTQLAARPAVPKTLAALQRRFGRPLLAFAVLAADRPDAITMEAVSDAERGERAVILRMGHSVPPREWRPDGRFLFRAEQIKDVSEIYGRWIALWEEAAPEIATFVDAVTEGTTYSRARLLASVVALEGYWRTRQPPTPCTGSQPNLLEKLIALRAHTGVVAAQIGATDDNLKLLVAARNLYAHLDQHHVPLSDEQIDQALLPNCRRAAALMQACLLRDLGITPDRISDMFAEHHAAWPLV
jgi:hypothetical protein